MLERACGRLGPERRRLVGVDLVAGAVVGDRLGGCVVPRCVSLIGSWAARAEQCVGVFVLAEGAAVLVCRRFGIHRNPAAARHGIPVRTRHADGRLLWLRRSWTARRRVEMVLMGERRRDRGEIGFLAADVLGELSDLVSVWIGVDVLVARVDVGGLAGARERDVAALTGGVLGDDQMRAVAGVALGRERVLDVCQANRRLIDLLLIERELVAVGELDAGELLTGIDGRDRGGGTVA